MRAFSGICLLLAQLGIVLLSYTCFAGDPADPVQTVREKFHARGFSDRDIDDLVATVSQIERRTDATTTTGSPTPSHAQMMAPSGKELAADFNARGFVDLATSMGLVVIESIPTGASIKLDNQSPDCGEKTSVRCWVPQGTHTITLTMEGYWPESGTCDVPAMGRIPFTRTLRPRP